MRGKAICTGCIHAMDKICPFCRIPTNDDVIKQAQKRADAGDVRAIQTIGSYSQGRCGLRQDHTKALELWQQAVELGHVKAYYIGCAYQEGRGINRDMKKALHYWGLAAMKGDADSRFNLGVFEHKAGNTERALKHYMLAVESGHNGSLTNI